jgi:hypothetical protein
MFGALYRTVMGRQRGLNEYAFDAVVIKEET